MSIYRFVIIAFGSLLSISFIACRSDKNLTSNREEIYTSAVSGDSITLKDDDISELKRGDEIILGKYEFNQEKLRITYKYGGSDRVSYFAKSQDGYRDDHGSIFLDAKSLEEKREKDRRDYNDRIAQEQKAREKEVAEKQEALRLLKLSETSTKVISSWNITKLRRKGDDLESGPVRKITASINDCDLTITITPDPQQYSCVMKFRKMCDLNINNDYVILSSLTAGVEARDMYDRGTISCQFEFETVQTFNKFSNELVQAIDEWRKVHNKVKFVDMEYRDNRNPLTDAPKLIIGTWRDENSQITYNADGTATGRHIKKGMTFKGKWSIDGDIYSATILELDGKPVDDRTGTRSRILEMTPSQFITKDLDEKQREWHATKVR